MIKKAIAVITLTTLLLCSFITISNASYTLTVLGDVDGDEKISTTDFLRIKSFSLNQRAFSELEFLEADIDGNRNINTADYISLKEIVLSDGELKAVNLYVADEQAYSLVPKVSFFDGSIENLISILAEEKAIPENTKVYSFSIKEKTAYIDLSKEFGKALEMGAAEETLVSGSLVNTIIRCYNVEKVFFTIEGEILTTGYKCYDSPLGFYSLITLYIPDADLMYFEPSETDFDGTVNGIARILSACCNSFPEGVTVNSFSISNDVAYIDLSEEFGKALEKGTMGEAIVSGSFVNTIIKYYNVERVYFTVEGKIFESGHITYDEPLGFSDKLF